jgi:hypothetical protein
MMNTLEIQHLENIMNDVIVTPQFPARPTLNEHLFDCRVHLLLKKSETLQVGETRKLETSCIIHPHHGWKLYTKPEPLNQNKFYFHRKCLKDKMNSFRVNVQLTNVQNKVVKLPQGKHVGYLVLLTVKI